MTSFNSIHINNISFTATQQDVEKFFEGLPNSKGVKILFMPTHRGSSNNRGFCNVELPSEEQAVAFMETVKTSEFNGRQLGAEPLKAFEKKERRPMFNSKRVNTRRRPNKYAPHSIHITNLPFNATRQELIEYFQLGGEHTKGFWITNFPMVSDTRNRGFCDVALTSAEQVEQVIEDLDQSDYYGRTIRVTKSQYKPQSFGRFRKEETEDHENSEESHDHEEVQEHEHEV